LESRGAGCGWTLIASTSVIASSNPTWDGPMVDAERIVGAAPSLEPYLLSLIEDFYDEIERHPDARKVTTVAKPLEQLEEVRFRVVLIDMRNPDGDGRSIFREVRRANPTHVPS